MRTQGTLTQWNDERGFGFITCGADRIFVHISAFPRDGVRPTLNERVSFDTETGPNGKPRAIRVMRPGQRAEPARTESRRFRREPRQRSGTGLFLLIVVTLGMFAYAKFQQRPQRTPPSGLLQSTPGAATGATAPFRCDGRTHCSQMRSCEEARYFLAHCPNTTMDGDRDGNPCEQQHCN